MPVVKRSAYALREGMLTPDSCRLGRSSGLATTTAAVALLILQHPVQAAPQGGSVVSGTATIATSGATTNINQSTNKAIINWTSFSVASNETVNFNQPSATSVTLNRVIGNESSVIAGAINANGQVFLVNSNGILFTGTSSVNVGGLVASTLDISNADFLAGNYVFSGSSTDSVVNKGALTAASGGYVSLLGKTVSNQGVITATLGTVSLNAGSKITLNFEGNSLVDVSIDEGVLDALVENKQLIKADGGKVIMTAKAADAVLSAQVNNSGTIQARTMADLTGGTTTYRKGSITLKADGGTTTVSGTLDASAPNGGDGGSIETSGNTVTIDEAASITTLASYGSTGTWLIDPDGFTIGTGGDISATLLSTLLQSNNIEIESTDGSGSDGDITVAEAVSWSGSTTLTLTATNDINVEAAITATGNNAGLTLTATNGSIYIDAPITLSGSYDTLTLNANTTSGYVYVNDAVTLSGDYGDALVINAYDYSILTSASYSGTTTDDDGNVVAVEDTSGGVYGSLSFTSSQGSASNDSLTINGNVYTLIYSMAQLDALDGYNAATGTGTAAAVSGYYALATDLDASGTTYTKALIGTSSSTAFNGTFTGLGHTIDGLTLSTGNTNYVGLIGYAKGTSSSYTVLRDIGLTNAYVDGVSYIGSLVGYAYYATIFNAYATGILTSTTTATTNSLSNAGGLVGYLLYGDISYAFADVDIIGPEEYGTSSNGATGRGAANVGGLVGGVVYGNVSHAHATGDVSCTSTCGGLVGLGNRINISYSYASGDVTGYDLITGYDDEGIPTGTIANTLGGLAGSVSLATVSYSFATGDISNGGAFGADNAAAGGLIGYASNAAISNTWASGDVTSRYGGGGGLVGYLLSSTTTQSGWNSTTSITDSYATGNVTAQTTGVSGGSAGGLVGLVKDVTNSGYAITISNTYATGDVTGITNNHHGGSAGGLIGSIETGNVTVTDSSATGEVSCEMCTAGGLVGSTVAGNTITNSYATGSVYSYYGVAGGLVGVNAGTIADSWASGTVSAGDAAGGLVGLNDSTGSVSGSSASGNTTLLDVFSTDGHAAGGLVGINRGDATESQATGDVTTESGNGIAGGIVGANAGSVTNSSGTGSISQNGEAGGSAIGANSDAFGTVGTESGNSYVDVKAVAAAEAAAARQARLQAAANATMVTATTGVEEAADNPPSASQAKAGSAATAALAGPAVDDDIDTAAAPPAATPVPRDDEERRRRQARNARPVTKPQPGYGASIRSIDVDGQHFDLEKETPAAPTPAVPAEPAAPAAPAAQ